MTNTFRLAVMALLTGVACGQAAPPVRMRSMGSEMNFDAGSPKALEAFLVGGWYQPDGHYLILSPGGRATVGQLYLAPPRSATWHADTTTSFVYQVGGSSSAVKVPIAFVSKSWMYREGPDGQADVPNGYTRDDGTPFVRLRGVWMLKGDTPDHYYEYWFSSPDFFQISEYRAGHFVNGYPVYCAWSPGHVTGPVNSPNQSPVVFAVSVAGKVLTMVPQGKPAMRLTRCVRSASNNACLAP